MPTLLWCYLFGDSVMFHQILKLVLLQLEWFSSHRRAAPPQAAKAPGASGKPPGLGLKLLLHLLLY